MVTRRRQPMCVYGAALLLIAACVAVPLAKPSDSAGISAVAKTEHFTLRRTWSAPGTNAWVMTFSGNGDRLFVIGSGNAIRGWDLKSGRVVFDARPPGFVNRFALTPDSRYILTAGETRWGGGEGDIQVWEVATGHLARRWAAHGKRAYCIACRPDGKAFATGGADEFVRVWALPSCKEIRRLRLPRVSARVPGSAGELAFFPLGKKVLVCSHGLHVWDVDAGPLKYLEGSKERSNEEDVVTFPGAAVSPDGKWVAACMRRAAYIRLASGRYALADQPEKFSLRIWDAATGKAVADFPREGQESVTFDPASRHLVSAEGDTTFGNATFRLSQDIVRFWDLARKRCTFSWHVPKGGVLVAFSPNGDRLATAHMDGSVRVWRYRPDSDR